MARRHQKKRNGLLIYEFLVQTISKALVEGDKRRSGAALKILRRHFKPGTVLYREFRLMNALVKTTVSSEHVAASILNEARSAANTFDEKSENTLEREKSIVIRNINHVLNDQDFYDQHVPNYRTLATVQCLVNEWRAKDRDISAIGLYEDLVMKHLLSDKTPPPSPPVAQETPGTTRLLMKVMTKKLNEKYAGALSESQRALVKAYAYSTASNSDDAVRKKMTEVRDDVLSVISRTTDVPGGEYVEKKLQEAKTALLSETLETIDEESVTRFMLYSRLGDELTSEETADE